MKTRSRLKILILIFSTMTMVLSIALVTATSQSASAAPDFEDLILTNADPSGTITTLAGDISVDVTSTWGSEGGWSDGHYAGLGVGFFNNTTPGDNSQSWVRWTFSSPITTFRIFYGDMEAPILDSGDPTSYIANIGGTTMPIDLRDTGSGGYRVATGTLNAWNEGVFGADGIISCVTSPCGGWVELNVPEGVSFIETRSSTSLDAGWNEVGIAVDVNAPFASPTTTPSTVVPGSTQVTLPATGVNPRILFWNAIMMLGLGAMLMLSIRKRQQKLL